MATLKIPEICPSCGAQGSLTKVERELVCSSPGCGRAFPAFPSQGLDAPKRKRSPAAKAKVTK